MNIVKVIVAFFVLLLVFSASGCKKMVEPNPPETTINEANIYSNDATAIAVLTGIYARLSAGSLAAGSGGISIYSGLSADELTLYTGSTSITLSAYYRNALIENPATKIGHEVWNGAYLYIYTCNVAIEKLNNNSALTVKVKEQLLGEARFVRALLYFYLVNLYGDVPLVLSSDYTKNALLPRTPSASVYQQIIADLKEAKALLSAIYLDGNLQNYVGTAERLRPTKWAASALLARVYLYTEDFVNAELEASLLINNSLYALSPMTGAGRAFTKNCTEAIWQLQPVLTGRNTEDAWLFIIPSTGPANSYPVYLSDTLLSVFEPTDQRKIRWINSVTVSGKTYYYPFKYQSAKLNDPVTEYLMVLRLGEQYLIRAEARNQQGKLSEAIADLNSIRSRAGLPGTTATNKIALTISIQHERQTELFTEWGNRWLDLKRTNAVDSVMSMITPKKGGSWKSGWKLYPIYFTDIERDANLTQNPDY